MSEVNPDLEIKIVGKRGGRVQFTCEKCGKVTTQKKSRFESNTHHFCSKECSNHATFREIPYNSIEFECEECGKKANETKSQNMKVRHHFCSRGCRLIWRQKNLNVVFECEWCGEKIIRRRVQYEKQKHHFCDQKCQGQYTQEKNRISMKCAVCGKEVTRTKLYMEQRKSGRMFCSRKCRDQFHKKYPYEFQDYTSEERREKIIERNKKLWEDPEFRENQIKTHMGKVASEETKQKMRKSAHRGEDHPNWRGGRYTEDFEASHNMSINAWHYLSIKIRKRDNQECQICRSTEQLHVHHIIPRVIGIDNRPQNLITLCSSCHPEVERKWEDYVNYFQINNIQKGMKNE